MSYGVFFPLALLLILSALGVVVSRNPIRSALSLVATLFLLAVTFLLLDAQLVAALQIVVYAGAIMVLFLFVIMLLNLQGEREAGNRAIRFLMIGSSAAFVLILLQGLILSNFSGPSSDALPPGFGSTGLLSEQLFTRFILPFEITSLLLLVAMVGAVVIARRKAQ